MHRLSVSEWVVKLWMPPVGLSSGVWRVVVTNLTDHTCTVRVYRDTKDTGNQEVVYRLSFSKLGPLHGVPVTQRFQPLGLLDRKRLLARKNNTTYWHSRWLYNGHGKHNALLLKSPRIVF